MSIHPTDRWQLPDGVNELLPQEAWRVELLRRRVMDVTRCWGYELVTPPMIEYLDSLLTGTGEKLDLQTFKVIDQHNGRTLGIRADMTPQVARIDAHTLSGPRINRLFYTGTVLRTRSDGAGSSRAPVQFGAELFGHVGPAGDIEIIHLMLETVLQSGLDKQSLLLDLGHVGIFRGLFQEAQSGDAEQSSLFDAVLRGSQPDLVSQLSSAEVPRSARSAFEQLMQLKGEANQVLEQARSRLADSDQSVQQALETLQAVVTAVTDEHPDLHVYIDLAELRGYRYHTGMLFALYDAHGTELARGGRYDAIGESFGRARPATGFSSELVNLAAAVAADQQAPGNEQQSGAIWVGLPIDRDVKKQIRQLRCEGERVICALDSSDADCIDSRCDRSLVRNQGQWQLVPLPQDNKLRD